MTSQRPSKQTESPGTLTGKFRWTPAVDVELVDNLLDCFTVGAMQIVFSAIATKYAIGFVEEHALGSDGDPVARRWWGLCINNNAFQPGLLLRMQGIEHRNKMLPAERYAIEKAVRCQHPDTRPAECKNPPTQAYIAMLLDRPVAWVAEHWLQGDAMDKKLAGISGFGLKV